MMPEIEILFENDDVIVINKPSGLVVHPDGKNSSNSISEWFVGEYPKAKNVGEPLKFKQKNGNEIIIPRHGVVHRLDKETSGALLLVKNQTSFEYFKKQFQEREIAKEYHAFVYGVIEKEDGIIDRPIGKSRSDFRKWSAQRGARGVLREAITEYKVLKRGRDYTFVAVKPKTGRTHQIRVHFKAINHPVVCDKLYAPKHKPILGFERLALHAYKLFFRSLDGNSLEVIAPYPKDFTRATEI